MDDKQFYNKPLYKENQPTQRMQNVVNNYRVDYKSYSNSSTSDYSSGILSLLAWVVMILIFTVLTRKIFNNDDSLTFRGFLDFLQNIKTTEFPLLDFSKIVQRDWGILNFLQQILNAILQIVNIFIFFAEGIVNIILYFTQFLGYLIGV